MAQNVLMGLKKIMIEPRASNRCYPVKLTEQNKILLNITSSICLSFLNQALLYSMSVGFTYRPWF